MSLFKKSNKTGGFIDEIRCDEPSYLIWKWHPLGLQSEKKQSGKCNSLGFFSSGKRGRGCCFCLQTKKWYFSGFYRRSV